MVVIVLISGCGAKKEEAYFDSASTKTETKSDMKMMETVTEETEEADYDDSGSFDGQELQLSGNTDSAAEALKNRKIIKTGFIYMESLTFEETVKEIKTLMNMYGGYSSHSDISGGSSHRDEYNSRYASYVLKIPAENFEEIFEALQGIGNVLNANEGVEDVTSQFTDIEARLKTLTVQEERLLAIMEKSDVIEDVIELEFALEEVRYEIESYTSSLRNLSDRVRFSTIEVRLQEVFEETVIEQPAVTMGQRISKGLDETFTEIKDGFENFIVFVIVEFPGIIVFGVIVFIFVHFIRKSQKKNLKNSTKVEGEVVDSNPSNTDTSK